LLFIFFISFFGNNMRPIEYPDDTIITAGQSLQHEGRRVTAFAIRQRIGGGDPVRIRAVWSAYQANREEQLPTAATDMLPAEFAEALEGLNTALLDDLRTLACRLYQHARDSAEARVREVLRTARTVQEQAEAEMTDARQNAITQDARIEALEEQVEAAQHSFCTLEQEKMELTRSLVALESKWEQVHAELGAIREQLTQAQTEAATATGKAAAEVERRQKSEQEVLQAQAQVAGLSTALETERNQRRQVEHQLEQLQAALTQTQEELAKASQALTQAQAGQHQAEAEATLLGSRVTLLEAQVQAAELGRQQAEQHAASLTRLLEQLGRAHSE
jgi:chromosome segregation ATPase